MVSHYVCSRKFHVTFYPSPAGRDSLEALHNLAGKLVIETALSTFKPLLVFLREREGQIVAYNLFPVPQGRTDEHYQPNDIREQI